MISLTTATSSALRGLCLAVTLSLAAAALSAPGTVQAQGLFDPVVKVNGSAITRFELEQRTELLKLLRAPADPARLARQQLIEDRLKIEAGAAHDVVISDEQLRAGMNNFASQGNLDADQMIALLERGGVARESFEAFVRSGLIWREVTQKLFANRVTVSKADLDRARATLMHGSGVRVLLSEIIIPYNAQVEAQVMAKAREISEMTSIAAFSAEARQYSATATREAGGHLPWQPLTTLPPVLRPLLLNLAPGEVTDPLPLDGAVALFQLRDIQETEVEQPSYSAIEYAAYYIPGGRSQDAINRAGQVAAQVDNCDDLYGIAKDQPENVLERGTRAPGDIPNDIAISLARLDPGEVSYDVTRANGQTLVLLMMCARSESLSGAEPTETDEDGQPIVTDETAQLSQQIGSQRLEAFANGYLERLRAEARIIEY